MNFLYSWNPMAKILVPLIILCSTFNFPSIYTHAPLTNVIFNAEIKLKKLFLLPNYIFFLLGPQVKYKAISCLVINTITIACIGNFTVYKKNFLRIRTFFPNKGIVSSGKHLYFALTVTITSC